MRSIVLGVCVFAAGCGGQGLDSPTSPTSVDFAATQARGGVQLPFRGSFSLDIEFAPPNPLAVGNGGGNATHLGKFTANVTAIVDFASGTSTGTFSFTAANGDQLFGTIVGVGVLIDPSLARITEVATIVDGTGRFEGATGTFTMVRFDSIDPTGGGGSGTFEGHINIERRG
jgi:hypothetical protein